MQRPILGRQRDTNQDGPIVYSYLLDEYRVGAHPGVQPPGLYRLEVLVRDQPRKLSLLCFHVMGEPL